MKDYREVQNVIFDFGGVLIDVDYHKTEKAFRSLMKDGNHAGFSQASQSEIFNLIETGDMTEAAFRDGLRSLFEQPHILDKDLDHAWNALLGEIWVDAFNFVKSVGDHKRIFLLSNTNSIHLRVARDEMIKALGSIEAFESIFEKTYYSHEMGLRKPSEEIFKQVLDENQLNAAETLFIDDSIQHIQSAKALGLVTHHLQGAVHELTLF